MTRPQMGHALSLRRPLSDSLVNQSVVLKVPTIPYAQKHMRHKMLGTVSKSSAEAYLDNSPKSAVQELCG